jgi:hypothetical protein
MTYEERRKRERPLNYTQAEWDQYLADLKASEDRAKKEHPDHFKISFRKRTYEDRWTRYRSKVLVSIGLSDDEVEELKFNRMTNPRVALFLRDIKAEVERIQVKYDLPDYAAAAEYRRDHYEDLLDINDIEDWDPYRRMGYFD